MTILAAFALALLIVIIGTAIYWLVGEPAKHTGYVPPNPPGWKNVKRERVSRQ